MATLAGVATARECAVVTPGTPIIHRPPPIRPLRLVLIAPFARYPKSTTRARVLPLARALAGRGHEVLVLVPPYDNPEEAGEAFYTGKARVEALLVDHSIPEQSLRQVAAQPRLALALTRRALSYRPHVVHVFKPKAVSGLAQLLLWQRRRFAGGPRVVLDTDDWEGFGGWNEYEAYAWWQKLACDWQERWGLEHADAVTVASRTLEAQAWSHRVPPTRVAYLPNGLDPEDYPGWRDGVSTAAPVELPPGDGPVLLLYTRFFEFQPQRLVDVFDHIHVAAPRARLLVVGAGKYGQERELEALARLRGLAGALTVAGWQPLAALPRLLAAGEVVLFPSDDNLANRAKCSAKLLEALWLGKAVVADRVGQQAEYIQHGAHGLLSDPEDPRTMAGAAVQLLQDPALIRRLGDAGRRRVEGQFNWPHLAAQAERAYGAALRRG